MVSTVKIINDFSNPQHFNLLTEKRRNTICQSSKIVHCTAATLFKKKTTYIYTYIYIYIGAGEKTLLTSLLLYRNNCIRIHGKRKRYKYT